MAAKIRRQPPIKGGRQQVGAGILVEIEAAIRAEQQRYGVSRSFVIATALAFAFGVDEQPDYAAPERSRVKRRHLTLTKRAAV